jgi:hypothetical protein
MSGVGGLASLGNNFPKKYRKAVRWEHGTRMEQKRPVINKGERFSLHLTAHSRFSNCAFSVKRNVNNSHKT